MIPLRLAVVFAAAAAPAAVDVALNGSLALDPKTAESVTTARRFSADISGAWSLPALVGGPVANDSTPVKSQSPSFQRIVIDPAGLSRFEGSGDPGKRVVLRVGDRKLGEAVVNTAGVWQVTLNEALKSGDHEITATVSDAANGANTGGQEVRISIPENVGSDVIVAFDAARDTPQIIPDAETPADDVRRRAEELGRAATNEFDDRVRELERARVVDATKRNRDRPDRPQAQGTDATIFDPLVNWMDQSTREYQRVIVPKLSNEGDPSLAPPQPEQKSPEPSQDQRQAQSPVLDLPKTDITIAFDGGLVETMRDWLSRANRGYQNDVMRKLETGGTNAQANPPRGESLDEEARRLAEERRSEEDAVKKAEEKQRAEDQKRQAEQRTREESERNAADAKKREADKTAEQKRLDDEQAKRSAETKADSERKAAEAKRQAEEARRNAAEAERRKQEAAATTARPTDESYRTAILAEEARIAELLNRQRDRLPQSRRPEPDDRVAEGSAIEGPVDTSQATSPPAQSSATATESSGPDTSVEPRALRRLLRSARHRSSRRNACLRRAGVVIDPPGTYVVKRGDTLMDIAEAHYDNPHRYRVIYRANRRRIVDPDLIYPCQRVFIPDIKR